MYQLTITVGLDIDDDDLEVNANSEGAAVAQDLAETAKKAVLERALGLGVPAVRSHAEGKTVWASGTA